MPSSKMKAATESGKNNPETFDLTEKVHYDDFPLEETLPEEMIFPEELNRFLRDRIRELTAENGCLRRGLEESEEKLSSLRKNASKVASIPGVGIRGSEVATTKIVELSKKCREQTAEIEGLKSRYKTIEAKLSEKELEIESLSKDRRKDSSLRSSLDSGDAGNHERPFTVEEELKNREEQIKLLQDKLQLVNAKLYESKNTCTSLRQEINKAQKLLCSEVGENVTIAGLSSHQSGWKGRAEQIQHLQQKLNDYETCSKGSTSSTTMEMRHMTNLRNIDKERRQRAEESAKELRQVNVDLEVSKRKRDAAKARVKVLENDLINAKQNVVLLNEKRTHDDQLIQALNGQLKAVEERFREREREILATKERVENECMNMCSEVNRLQASNDQLRRTVEERETEMDALRNGCKGISKLSPLSRGKTSDSTNSVASPTSRNCKSDYNEYVILAVSAEAERERLLELVIVLNRRLDQERFTTDSMAETLRGERNKLARLETKLQRIEMERVGMSKVNSGYRGRFSKSTISAESDERLKDETRFKLELLEEECLALKTRLATVQRDKTSDLLTYKQMLDQARKTFQDAYRGKPNSCSYSTVTI